MKNIAIIMVVLLSSCVAFGQHPLYKKGPKAKNYKVSKAENLPATKFSLHAQPSDKYEAGANAKNRTLNQEDKELISGYARTDLRRGTGANAKNRYVREARANESIIKVEEEEALEEREDSQTLQRR